MMTRSKLNALELSSQAADLFHRSSLSRSGHSLSIVKNKAYIFGGETADGKLASNEVHAVTLESSDNAEPQYAVIPAVAKVDGGKIPVARKAHAACALNICVAVFGGIDETGSTINDSTLWLFNTGTSSWETLEISNPDLVPKPRSGAQLFEYKNRLVLYGGTDSTGAPLKDVWHFDYPNKAWSQLPDAPLSTSNAAFSDGVLYAISGTDNMGGDLHFLLLMAKSEEEPTWHAVPYPTNPLTPGPLPRSEAGLIPVSTGFGRQYLLYMFGSRASTGDGTIEATETSEAVGGSKTATPQYWSDMWTYQLPSSDPEAKPTTNIYEAIKPAKIKDKIRGALGYDDGKHSWAEVEVLPPTDLTETEGKVHPGPRGSFAHDVMRDGRSIVIWGGVNPKGEREGDGWIIKLE